MNNTNKRTQYTKEKKQLVRDKYPLCKTLEDKEELAQELGMDSIHKLYNLASRLKVTRSYEEEGEEVTEEEPAVRYDACDDRSRWLLREDPATTIFTPEDDRYIRRHFGSSPIEHIAYHRNHTETAIAWRARQLNVRKVAKYWPADKVAAWLGVSVPELFSLHRFGLDIFPCCDIKGNLTITLVSTTSLARLFSHEQAFTLLQQRDADKFFITEIQSSVRDIQTEQDTWEINRWVSHGHTCLNPFSGICFGLFYNGNDDKISGGNILPEDLSPAKNVASDHWLRSN